MRNLRFALVILTAAVLNVSWGMAQNAPAATSAPAATPAGGVTTQLTGKMPVAVDSAKMLQLKDGRQKELQQQARLRQMLYDKINSLAAMMRDFDDASSSMNGLSGLGRIEQLQFKAERYAAERQVRTQIQKEVFALASIIQELRATEDKVADWNRLIEAENKVLQMKLEVSSGEAATAKEKDALDPRNFEYYTVKKSGDVKQISALPEVYSNSNAWKYLFDANRDKIPAPDTVIPAGTTLIVPNIKTEKAFINME